MVAMHGRIAPVNDDLFRYIFYYWCRSSSDVYYDDYDEKYRFNIETVLLNRAKLVGLGRHVRNGGGGGGKKQQQNESSECQYNMVFGLVHHLTKSAEG